MDLENGTLCLFRKGKAFVDVEVLMFHFISAFPLRESGQNKRERLFRKQ